MRRDDGARTGDGGCATNACPTALTTDLAGLIHDGENLLCGGSLGGAAPIRCSVRLWCGPAIHLPAIQSPIPHPSTIRADEVVPVRRLAFVIIAVAAAQAQQRMRWCFGGLMVEPRILVVKIKLLVPIGAKAGDAPGSLRAQRRHGDQPLNGICRVCRWTSI